MADSKISALTANTALTGTEQIPAVQGGANVKATPADLARYFSATPKPPKCSFHGDSIALLMGNMEPMSPLFHALAAQPRDLYMATSGSETSGTVQSGNFGVSGKKSGALYAGLNRTSTLLSAEDPGDMNTVARLALITAYAPDIMFIENGSNESAIASALDSTILNVKDVIAANPNPNKKVVIFAPFPKASYDAHVRNFNRWAEQMARSTPGYYYVDWRSITVDESSATGAPLATDSADGVHPNVFNAIKMIPLMNALFDRLGIPKMFPRGVSQLDVYNVSTAPADNLLGSKGAFTGTTGTVGGNSTGTLATGWTGSTSNAELTMALAKGTFTDANGKVRSGQSLTFGGGPLTADRSFTIQATLNAASPQSKQHFSQLVAQLTSMVGCTGVGFYVQSGNGATITEARMGIKMTRAIQASDLIPNSATPRDQFLVNPVAFVPAAVNTAAFIFYIQGWFVSGTAAPAGTIWLADAGVWPEMTSL